VTETFAASEAVQLAVVERSGFIESRHTGSAVVVGPDGSVLTALGNPAAPIFPRSSLKPFQAVAVMNTGVALTGAPAVLAAASHTGTPEHIAIVRRLLSEAKLDERALRCPSAYPHDRGARTALIAAGTPKAPLYMECSGKHASMLLSCTRNGWSTEDYLEPEHPLQVQVRDVVERLTGEKVVASGVDGCGTPVYAMSLIALAHGIQRIATASSSSPFALYRNSAVLASAVLDNAWAIDGPGRPNTVVIDRLGVFAKTGAEGVVAATAPDGTTVTLKVLDGSPRAALAVALALLVDVGALEREPVARVWPQLGLAVRGGGGIVGSIRPEYVRNN
jgi:L-asparaginase II